MRAFPPLLSCSAILCGAALLSGCGDSQGDAPKPGGADKEAGIPPMQKAIYLRSEAARPPGTGFRNSATLTMANAHLLTRRGDANSDGTATMVMREQWDVDQLSPTERAFTIKEMSRTFDTVIDGKPKNERTESTLADIPLKVTRAGESAPWVLATGDEKFSPLQEVELRMLGNLWTEGSEEIYPAEPLELGQSWEADPKAFAMIVSPRLRIESGKVTCKLDEITVLRGERCGSVSVALDVAGTFEMDGSSGIHVQITLAGTIMRSLYKNYDMRTELKGTMQMQMEFPEQDTTISISGGAEFLQLATLEEPETR